MIISKTRFHRNFELINARKASFPDKKYFVNCFIDQLNKKYKAVLKAICVTDTDFQKHVEQMNILSVESIGVDKPNSMVRFELPPDGKIRGVSEILYDRVSISRYFGISADISLVGSTDNSDIDSLVRKEVVIDWDLWKEHTDKGTLDNLIHRKISYLFGRTFSHQGVIMTYEPQSKEYTSVKPLALLVPDPARIIKGWKRAEYITTIDKGTVEYQDLSIYLRLVSSNHLFIEDGEIIVRVKLRRQTHHYNHEHEGTTHVDG